MRTNLTCEACRAEMTALVDYAIHPAVARALESHIAECAGCSARLEEHRAIAALARRLPEIEAPAWLEDRVVRAVTRPERMRALYRRAGALALAASFALSVGLIAFYPRLAAMFGLPTPGKAIAGAVGSLVSILVGIPKFVAGEAAFYGPLAHKFGAAFQGLAALPKAGLVVLQSPEGQTAGVILLTLGVAIFWFLRPSRSHERGIGHACLAL